jgi:CPA1 family monovalent cation:H+ antiporter
LFIKETGGGILFGGLLGYMGFYILRSIDHYVIEVLVTLAIVMGGYLIAGQLHISASLAIVMAGIIQAIRAEKKE